MGIKKATDKRAKKYSYWERLWTLLEDYKQILIVNCNNVSSKQIQDIRFKLRALDAVVVMGKNVYNFYSFI
jgi:large subunit ribosomal protein LP0